MKFQVALICLCLSLVSCIKTPGEGGTASITGQVNVIRRVQINNPTSTVDTIPGADVKVYLMYGSSISPDDKIVTNPDGGFAFNWLRTGDYTLYVYSEDTSSVALTLPKIAFSYDVELLDKDEVKVLDPILIYDVY